MKKGFTLIELLIVVAIIGILAGVGIPMYNGYMADAKIKATTVNHKNIVNFISASLTKCASGASNIVLKGHERRPEKDVYVSCNNSSFYFAQNFVNHFNNTGFKNHMRDDIFAVQFEKSWGEQGLTRIWYTNNTITVITNPGKEDGFNDFLEASIPKE